MSIGPQLQQGGRARSRSLKTLSEPVKELPAFQATRPRGGAHSRLLASAFARTRDRLTSPHSTATSMPETVPEIRRIVGKTERPSAADDERWGVPSRVRNGAPPGPSAVEPSNSKEPSRGSGDSAAERNRQTPRPIESPPRNSDALDHWPRQKRRKVQAIRQAEEREGTEAKTRVCRVGEIRREARPIRERGRAIAAASSSGARRSGHPDGRRGGPQGPGRAN